MHLPPVIILGRASGPDHLNTRGAPIMKRSIAVLALASTLALSGTTYLAYAQGVTFQKGQAPGEVAVVRLAGTPVFNSKTDVIGTIGDVVLGPDGRATTVIINV